MRTTNPVLARFTETARAMRTAAAGDTMTVAGTATKGVLLLAVLAFSTSYTWVQLTGARGDLLGPAMLVGGLGGFVLALLTSFRPQWAPVTAPLYASLEGIFLGAVSALYNQRFAGLPQQAVLLTLGVAAGVLVLYRLRVLRATAGLKRMLFGAMLGIALFYLGSMVLSLFGVQIGYFTSSGPLAIGINLAIAGVAALNLVLDFDRIEEGARAGAPKAMEWFAAFGLMVTLIWLYLELLRLLSRLQGRRD